ncbi:MAG: MaoC family dehydratase N-terminal domain-containing protein [Actinobacteria bacterium]|nr:MaoC family dehydratase N-terminal domain-containing protein [Actinomycetota bacterium]
MSGATTAEATNAEYDEATAARISDEDIERDRRALGRMFASRTREYFSTATVENIRNFANSYGDDNPLYCDPDYGRATRWGGQIAPPIASAILNAPLLGERPARELRGGSYRGIHSFVSGGTWEWYRPVRPGDTLYSFEGLDSVETKPSRFAGRSVLRTRKVVKINQDADVVGVYRELVIFAERGTARKKGKYNDIPEPSYSDDDIAEIDARYAAERRRGAEPRYWEDVEVGEALPALTKGPLTTRDIIVFHAGGYGFSPFGLWTSRLDHDNRQRIPVFYVDNEQGIPDVAQRVHWDTNWARAVGIPRPYDYGVLRECWFHHYLTDWIGDDGWVVRQHDEIRKFNYHGDWHAASGEVTGKRHEDGLTLVDVEVRLTNQRGEDTTIGDATVSLPSRDHGPALLPTPPAELRRSAYRMLQHHGELERDGTEPPTVSV